jgi:hypothetical protein
MSDESKGEARVERPGPVPLEQKKPYASPTLRRLGTVRSLTLTGGMTVTDGSFGRKRIM